MPDDPEAALIGAQFKHSVDLLRMKIAALEAKHDFEMAALQAVSNAKTELYEFKIAALEAKRVDDFKAFGVPGKQGGRLRSPGFEHPLNWLSVHRWRAHGIGGVS